MVFMLRLNDIVAKATIKDATVFITVDVEKCPENRENKSINQDKLEDFFGHLEDTQGSANWPRFEFTFTSETRRLAVYFGEEIVKGMENLDIWRAVKMQSLTNADENNNYTAKIICAMS